MTSHYQKRQIQLKYKEEMKNKKEEKSHPKKAFIIATVIMIMIILDYHFDSKPLAW